MESESKKNYWNLKPYWCQPWSIITFGILVLIFSWTFLKNFIITTIVGFFIIAWWALFLIIVPRLYDETTNKT